jgi:hypothetical protein
MPHTFLFPSAEGARQQSPGRKPWGMGSGIEAALKGRHRWQKPVSPLQGSMCLLNPSQGLRPGLCCLAPLGLLRLSSPQLFPGAVLCRSFGAGIFDCSLQKAKSMRHWASRRLTGANTGDFRINQRAAASPSQSARWWMLRSWSWNRLIRYWNSGKVRRRDA